MRKLRRTAVAMAAAQVALTWSGLAMAQTEPAPASPSGEGQKLETVVVTGQRAALASAQKIKQEAEVIVDSVVAEEAGKLPDKSITEVLQRVVGVTMDRNRSRGDPEHFSVEGSGISVRGLTWGSSTLNGREVFSAGWPGRELSWGDVPPELMSRVDVYKNPPATLIEGSVSGQVDLRTHLPFDFKDTKRAISFSTNYSELSGKASPAVSGLLSTRGDSEWGQWGALVDLSYNRTTTHNDTVQLDAYFPRTDLVPGETVWVPKSASWRSNTSDNERAGVYGALQWKKNDKESSLTYFHSGYQTQGTERAIFSGVENPYRSVITDGVYNSNGVLTSGTYTYPIGGLGANNFAAGGVGMHTDTGWDESTSQARELAWNFKWRVNDRWAFAQDLQWVHAQHKSRSGVVSLGTFVPSVGVNTGTDPLQLTFDQTATDFLANPENYYWNFMMPSDSRAKADLYAWKGDGSFLFEDPVLREFQFGLRLTHRKSLREEANGSGWYSIAQPWAVKPTDVPGQLPTFNGDWQPRGSLGYLSDPRYALPTQAVAYNNFFNGKMVAPPTLIVPDMAFVRDYPNSFQQLAQLLIAQCEDGKALRNDVDKDCSQEGADWRALTYDGDPSKTSRQRENTQAIYGSLRFGFDDWKYPVEGNLGARVVHTHTVAHGYTVFTPSYSSTTPPHVPRFGPISEPLNVDRSSTEVLPSLNMKVQLAKQLQSRLAYSKGMNRPSFESLSEYIKLDQKITMNSSNTAVEQITYTGENKGNVNLKPVTSHNYDVTLEWYPRGGSSLTMAVFHKQVRDIIMKSTVTKTYQDLAGNSQEFLITAPDNVAKGRVSGLEIAGQTYLEHVPGLEKLPEWAKGFGISANYTYIDAKQTLYNPYNIPYCPANGSFNNASLSVYGCDTNGLPFKDLPIPYLSKNAFNVMFLYDKGPLSARLAYSWRGRYLQATNANGTQGTDGTSADPARNGAQDVGWGLPTWAEAVGQWDAGIGYRFDENLSLSFNVTNLTDKVQKQLQQQHIGMMDRAWFEPGRSYKLQVGYSF